MANSSRHVSDELLHEAVDVAVLSYERPSRTNSFRALLGQVFLSRRGISHDGAGRFVAGVHLHV